MTIARTDQASPLSWSSFLELAVERPASDGTWFLALSVDAEMAPGVAARALRPPRPDQRRLLGLAAGTYRVLVNDGARATSDPVVVEPGVEATVAVTLHRRRVRGRLLDAVGAPAGRVSFAVVARTERLRRRATTDASGAFVIDALPANLTEIEVSREGYVPLRLALPNDGELGAIRLQPADTAR